MPALPPLNKGKRGGKGWFLFGAPQGRLEAAAVPLASPPCSCQKRHVSMRGLMGVHTPRRYDYIFQNLTIKYLRKGT